MICDNDIDTKKNPIISKVHIGNEYFLCMWDLILNETQDVNTDQTLKVATLSLHVRLLATVILPLRT